MLARRNGTVRIAHGLTAIGLVLAALAGCGSPPPDAHTLLGDAKKSVDASRTVHFKLSSSNAQSSSTALVGGDGTAARPDGFAGQLNVSIQGLIITIKIASVGGVFYVQLPFSTTWTVARADQYGFGDPAQLINTDHGLTSLLAEAKSPALGEQDRYNGELLYEVTCRLPGADVARLLTSADPTQDDTAVIGISADSHQLRRVVLTGPFFDKNKSSTYTLVLDNYGANVTVTAPPVSSPSPSPTGSPAAGASPAGG